MQKLAVAAVNGHWVKRSTRDEAPHSPFCLVQVLTRRLSKDWIYSLVVILLPVIMNFSWIIIKRKRVKAQHTVCRRCREQLWPLETLVYSRDIKLMLNQAVGYWKGEIRPLSLWAKGYSKIVETSLRSKRFRASSSRTLGREQKKRNDGGGGGERRKRLPANPTILKNCVRPRTQLLIGAVLVVLIT